jgi:hypothetical protein
MSAQGRLTDELMYAVCEDALDDYGYLLEVGATAGQVKKSLGAVKVIGVAYKSTKDPITLVAAANQKVAIIRHGQAWVKFGATHAVVVAFTSSICAMTGGLGQVQTVTNAMVHSERLIRIGTALTPLAVNTAGYVLVDLNLPE